MPIAARTSRRRGFTGLRLFTGLLALSVGLAAARGARADIDGDGVPDQVDVCQNTPPDILVDANGRPLGDLDGDCDVDLLDFAIILSNYTGPLAPVTCTGCNDLLQNGGETDVDCGGEVCLPCADGRACHAASDCQSGRCLGEICVAP